MFAVDVVITVAAARVHHGANTRGRKSEGILYDTED
jgi:hypothetical protein